jgi:hypothetical protein
MPATDRGAAAPSPILVDGWLTELGLDPIERIERDGITSWDLVLDGRRRFDIRVTLILDPGLACIAWVHYAPPLTDGFRRSYRKLLRWNDEYPFAKFAISTDERPVLSAELPIDRLDRDAVGLALARLLALCDVLADDSAGWIWPDGKVPPANGRISRQVGLLARYANQLAELVEA